MMDPENVGLDTIVKVTHWLRGVWEMRRRAGLVQQWVDSIPSPTKSTTEKVTAVTEENPTPPATPVSSKDSIYANPSMTISTPITVPGSPAITMTGSRSPIAHSRLARDPSFQSDSSHCSSVESLLELRRADPEAILLGLGFGGCPASSQETGPLSRIPKRFLQPSKLKGIAINDFVKHQQETSESLDSASLGYRGLTGSPYVAPSEIVQKIMERLREHESHEQDAYTVHNNNTEPYSPIYQDTNRLSVLSPDNRQFLERPRSKSPDMRNKRMIIGQKSFAFGCDGDLIEINPLSQEEEDEAQHDTSTNGKADNHSIELEVTSVAVEPLLEANLEGPTFTNKESNKSKSTISNGRQDKRLAKQLSLEDSAPDLIAASPDSDPLLEEDEVFSCSRSYGNSMDSSSMEDSRRMDGSVGSERWKTTRSEDERTLSSSPRRASDGFCDARLPWTRLLREEGRRFSDGVIRQSPSLLNRRRSLRRQARISDTEASQYHEPKSGGSNLAEETEQLQYNSKGEPPRVAETTKLEANETEGKNPRSDRLSTSDSEYSREAPADVNGNASLESGSPAPSAKKVKTRSGLSALRDMHSSIMSIRMEPGF